MLYKTADKLDHKYILYNKDETFLHYSTVIFSTSCFQWIYTNVFFALFNNFTFANMTFGNLPSVSGMMSKQLGKCYRWFLIHDDWLDCTSSEDYARSYLDADKITLLPGEGDVCWGRARRRMCILTFFTVDIFIYFRGEDMSRVG